VFAGEQLEAYAGGMRAPPATLLPLWEEWQGPLPRALLALAHRAGCEGPPVARLPLGWQPAAAAELLPPLALGELVALLQLHYSQVRGSAGGRARQSC
jgi:hypothetical protein